MAPSMMHEPFSQRDNNGDDNPCDEKAQGPNEVDKVHLWLRTLACATRPRPPFLFKLVENPRFSKSQDGLGESVP